MGYYKTYTVCKIGLNSGYIEIKIQTDEKM